MMRYTLIINPKTRECYAPGVQTGKMEVVDFLPGTNPPTLMLKEAGTTYFASRGYYPYARAKYRCCQVLEQKLYPRDESKIAFLVEDICSAPIKPKDKYLSDLSGRLQRAHSRITEEVTNN